MNRCGSTRTRLRYNSTAPKLELVKALLPQVAQKGLTDRICPRCSMWHFRHLDSCFLERYKQRSEPVIILDQEGRSFVYGSAEGSVQHRTLTERPKLFTIHYIKILEELTPMQNWDHQSYV